MAASKEEARRERVRDFVSRNPDMSSSQVVKHFVLEGYTRATVYNIIRRIRDRIPMKKKKGGGKKEVKFTSVIKNKLVEMFDNEDTWSISRAAKRLKVCRNKIRGWLKELGIVRKAKKDAPYADPKQRKKQTVILNKISRDEFRAAADSNDIIMDDETYIDVNSHDFAGNNHYFTSGHDSVPEDVQFKMKKKFPDKLLLWLAISRKGHSHPYFHSRSLGAINQQYYQNECIKKRLIPFIRDNYPDHNYLFWPDLASSHYSNSTQLLLQENEVKFLPKDRNPPNVPQIRPIERFWAHLKAKVYQPPYKPKSVDCLKERVKKMLKEFPPSYFERLMSGVGPKVRKAANRGVLSVIN